MKTWKEKAMLGCVGVLLLAMLSIFMKYPTEKIAKLSQLDNSFVRTFVPEALEEKEGAHKEHPVAWEKMYPFSGEKESMLLVMPRKLMHIKTRMEEGIEKKITDRTAEHFLGYPWLVEHGRALEVALGWDIVSPVQQVAHFPDGYLTFAYPWQDMTERIHAVQDLAETAEENHARFVFVQAPFKVNKYGDDEIRNRFDFSNDNADRLLEGLRAAKMDVLDLRDDINRTSPEDYHAQFYRTDHHWTPQTALRVAHYLAGYLQKEEGIFVDEAHFSEEDYLWHVKEDWFLGSQGKRATLARTQMEDFMWMEPKAQTAFHFEIPSRNIDETGPFSVMLYPYAMETKNVYQRNPYAAFLYGDCPLTRMENLQMSDAPEQKVLFLSDSFSDALLPFLAMGIKNIVKIDPRCFTGSIKDFIAKEKPDVIVVMYTASYSGPVKWEGHKDKFDFR